MLVIIIYLNPELERKAVQNNFNINAQVIKEEDNIIEQAKVYDLSKYTLKTLLNITDEDFSYHDIMCEAIILNCLFNSTLSLLSKDNINKLQELYDKIINNPNYQDKYKDDKICRSIVLNSLNKTKPFIKELQK